MIWDLHCHFNGFNGRTPEEMGAEIIRFGDHMGIERFCLYMGRTFITDPTVEQLREANDWVLRALDHWRDRFVGFAYLSPKHLQVSLDEINRCIRDGPMCGIKLWVAKRCNSPEVDPIIERAAALKAVIFQHTWLKTGGNLPGESSPADLAELAMRHPKIPIICGHTGGNWEIGIRTIRGLPNVSSDLAGSDPTNGYVDMAVRELGAERIIYGSDCGGRSIASQLAKVQGANVPEAAKKLILGENLKRMLTPIMNSKK